MKLLRMGIYCLKPIFSKAEIKRWIIASKHPEGELVQKFSIVRTKGFAALEVSFIFIRFYPISQFIHCR
jgi:hypothetical protein